MRGSEFVASDGELRASSIFAVGGSCRAFIGTAAFAHIPTRRMVNGAAGAANRGDLANLDFMIAARAQRSRFAFAGYDNSRD